MERQEIIDGIVEILKTVRTIDHEKLANITEETDFLTDLKTPRFCEAGLLASIFADAILT